MTSAKYERNQEIYDLRKSGMTLQSIADKYGVTEKTIRVILQKIEDRKSFIEKSK